jgi:hypothetical protein
MCAVIHFAICSATIMVLGTKAGANTPALEWDPNPEPTVTGYNVYCGTSSGNYTTVIDVGLETRLPLTNLTAAVTYYFAVTAYDANRLESPFSDEVWFTQGVDGTNAVQLPFSLANETNVPVLRFSGRTGQHCWIVASSDLLHWEQIYSTGLTDSISAEFKDLEGPRSWRFYRAIGEGQ